MFGIGFHGISIAQALSGLFFFGSKSTNLWVVWTERPQQALLITYGAKEVCEQVGISARQLEYWALIGVVQPILEPHGAKVFKRFTERDLFILKRVKLLTDEGVLVSRAAQKVKHELS